MLIKVSFYLQEDLMIRSKIGKVGLALAMMLLVALTAVTVLMIGQKVHATSVSNTTRIKNEAAFAAVFGMQPPTDKQEQEWMAPTVKRIMSELRTAHENQRLHMDSIRISPTLNRNVWDAEVAITSAQLLRLVRAIELAKEYKVYSEE
jgi:hypothetical protein